jgi:hypothetical protein
MLIFTLSWRLYFFPRTAKLYKCHIVKLQTTRSNRSANKYISLRFKQLCFVNLSIYWETPNAVFHCFAEQRLKITAKNQFQDIAGEV